MGEMVRWTAAMDEVLQIGRHTGATWDALAAALGVGRETVRERGRRIGALRTPAAARPRPVLDVGDRPPMRPGHEVSWGLITRGTVLEGEAYPLPWFD